MKQKLICGLLSLGLLLGSASAAEEGFTDVKPTDWFAPYVDICVEKGLMKGTGDGSFSPAGTITLAEVAAVAARLGSSYPGSPAIPQGAEGDPWYQPYVSYFSGLLGDSQLTRMLITQPTKSATRLEFFYLLSAVIPEAELAPINSITALPDTDSADILRFYNAGILTGTDDYGTFSGDRTLARSEVAAMLARIVEPERRLPFTPKTAPAAPADGGQELADQVALTVNGTPVTAQELAHFAVQIAYRYDSYYYSSLGTRLPWSEENQALIMDQAKAQSAAYVVMSAKAAQLGCQQLTQLAAAMAPSPTRQELEDYVSSADLLCAKHILVADESSAQSVISALKAQPTQTQFDNILALLGTDPGMKSSPSGYLFTAGEMVEEFEAGTRALAIGQYSEEPVQSSFGYHVILRLDPMDHPDLVSSYQSAVMNAWVDEQLKTAQVTENTAILDQIDLAGTYEAYLQSLAAGQ